MKKKLIYSDKRNSELKKNSVHFYAHITIPGPFQIIQSGGYCPSWRAFCGSITGMFVWMGYCTELESLGQW